MPTFFSLVARKFWFRSREKYFRGAVIFDALPGEKLRRWRIIDRRFDRFEKLYVHEVVPV